MMKLPKLISLLLVAILCFSAATLSVCAIQLGSITIRVETLADDTPVPGYKLRIASVADDQGWLDEDFAPAGITPADMLKQQLNPENAAKLVVYAEEHGVSGVLVICDSNGEVHFPRLDAGIYMVWPDADNELSFLPYLIYIPTMINETALWDIVSVPKVGTTPDPVPQPTPTPTPDPEVTPTPGPGGIIPIPPDPEVTPTPTPGPEVTPTPTPDPEVTPEPTPSPELTPPPGAEVTPTPTPGSEVTPTPTPDTPQIPQTGVNRLPAHLLFLAGLILIMLGIVFMVRGEGRKEDE